MAVSPVVAPPVVIDYGDSLNQIISELEPIVAGAADGGIALITAASPQLGAFLNLFGAKMASQFVASAATGLEGLVAGKTISVSPSNAIETFALNAITGALPKVASFFGDTLAPLISTEVSNLQQNPSARAPKTGIV